MPTERLHAIVNGRRMGILERNSQRVTLTYDATWREAEGAYPMSLSMPLAMEQHTTSVVLPFIWGLLPDDEEVLKRWGRRFGVSPRNPFKLLAHVGEDCAGAVQFVTMEREAAVLAGPLVPPAWLTERDVAERMRTLGQDAGAGRLATDTGQFSLPGACAPRCSSQEPRTLPSKMGGNARRTTVANSWYNCGTGGPVTGPGDSVCVHQDQEWHQS